MMGSCCTTGPRKHWLKYNHLLYLTQIMYASMFGSKELKAELFQENRRTPHCSCRSTMTRFFINSRLKLYKVHVLKLKVWLLIGLHSYFERCFQVLVFWDVPFNSCFFIFSWLISESLELSKQLRSEIGLESSLLELKNVHQLNYGGQVKPASFSNGLLQVRDGVLQALRVLIV